MAHAGSLSTTPLLAYVSDGESAAAIRGWANRQNLRDVAVEPGSVVEATEYLRAHASPQVLLVEIPSAEAAPALLDALADVVNPATKVIVAGKVDTLSFYHWLLGLGIQEYLLLPFTEAQLATAYAKGAAAPAPVAAGEPAARHIVAVLGARGGVGATTTALGIASILAHEHAKPTALIDLDPQWGSVALSLDLEPSRGLRDALEKPDRIDTLFLERVMIKPEPNLAILSAEESFAEPIAASANAGEALLAGLREKFGHIVLDLPRGLTPLVRQMLLSADHVVIVAEPSLLSLRDALRLKDFVTETLKRPAPQLVLNRMGLAPKQELTRADFAKHAGGAPAAHVPYLVDIAASMARGDSLLADAKLAPAMDPLRQLVAQWLGDAPASAPSKRSPFFKGRK